MNFAPTITTPQLVVAIFFTLVLTFYAFMLAGQWLMRRQKRRFRVQVVHDRTDHSILLVIDGSAYRFERESDVVELVTGLTGCLNNRQDHLDAKHLGAPRDSRRLGLALGNLRENGPDGKAIYFTPQEVCFFSKNVDFLVDGGDSDDTP